VLALTSFVAAIVGGSMLLTRRSIRFVVRCIRGRPWQPQATARASEPRLRSPEGGLGP
jgi:hypothetical protein